MNTNLLEFMNKLPSAYQDVLFFVLDDISHDGRDEAITTLDQRIKKIEIKIQRSKKRNERWCNSQENVQKLLAFMSENDKIDKSLELKMLKGLLVTRNDDLRELQEDAEFREFILRREKLLFLKEKLKERRSISELIYQKLHEK